MTQEQAEAIADDAGRLLGALGENPEFRNKAWDLVMAAMPAIVMVNTRKKWFR